MVPKVGLEPPLGSVSNSTEPQHNRAKSLHNKTFTPVAHTRLLHFHTHQKHNSDTSQQPICVWDVYDADLAKVVAAWEKLPQSIRRKIITIIDYHYYNYRRDENLNLLR